MSDESRADDVMEQGGRRFPLPGWRPSRGAAIFAAAALIVGLVAGYATGVRQHRGSAALSRPAATASAEPVPSPFATFSFTDVPALTQNIGACSQQHGRELQLGVQITNESAAPLTLQNATVVLPLPGMLKPITRQWGPCGSLAIGPLQGAQTLQPGGSTWLTVTFKVQVRCPGPAPVQFTVDYSTRGRPTKASLPGFSDLTQVPYSGCPPNTA